MENASKALLIAGSILIAILLIAVGVKIFDSTSGTTDNVDMTMNATEKATFNNQFISYIGTKNKAKVISLLNAVIVSNSTNTTHTIKINSDEDIQSKMNTLTEGNYTVKIEAGDYTNGYITNIKILDSSGTAI